MQDLDKGHNQCGAIDEVVVKLSHMKGRAERPARRVREMAVAGIKVHWVLTHSG
jgi:hypothetical protein